MRIRILSDLHTGFSEFDPPDTNADVVVLAGDIGVGTGGIDWAAQRYPKAPVVYVPGNHEYYGHDIGEKDSRFATAVASINVLVNEILDLGGVRIFGTKLWTVFKYNGEVEAWFSR